MATGTRSTPPVILSKLSDQGIDCFVQIDQKPLEVYQAKREGHVSSGYSMSQSGKTFEILVDDKRNGQSKTDLSVQLFIDGTHRCKITGEARKNQALSIKGERTGPMSRADFMFSALQTTDDDAVACTDEAFVKDVGTIVVRIWRIRITGQTNASHRPHPSSSKPAPMIDERAKKGSISHQTSHGPETAAKPRGSKKSIIQDIDPRNGKPYAEFRFMYRSKMLLEMNDIIATDKAQAEGDAQPVAGPSNAVKVKVEKRDVKREVIIIDSSDDDEPKVVKRAKPEQQIEVKAE